MLTTQKTLKHYTKLIPVIKTDTIAILLTLQAGYTIRNMLIYNFEVLLVL
jgi:hypothetical protein